LVFFGSQLASTILSIDPLTSWLGYYSRFNGGLVSVICYTLLYWAFVSNIDSKRAMKLVYVTLISGALVAFYGVLEHFGIDKKIWVQDVQSRVFSTLGQPNWLAAWLIALIPVTWSLILKTGIKLKSYKFWIYFSLSILLFWAMIFTKSRSGYLGFAIASVIFWGLTAWQNRREIKTLFLPLILVGAGIFVICLISGTEWTPSLKDLIKKPSAASQAQKAAQAGATALETGGTESSTIRRIVWTGAIQVWLHYPIFGTGVETFAYSYYLYRPAEHNLTSEWDFIYNKAHNEYLNFAANSGTAGILSYLALVGFTIYLFFKKGKPDNRDSFETGNLKFALLAGYVSILVTNFFGFSVVPIQLEFFLFPAIAATILISGTE
jgi:O-antigen ligase